MTVRRASAREVTFTSSLPQEHHRQLEALLFFNGRQDKVRRGIVDAIDRYGTPEIVSDAHGLRVRVAGPAEAQCVFAIEHIDRSSRPVGVILYTRDSFERITIMHLVVAEPYAAGGTYAREHLLLKLVQAVRRVARRTSGIRQVELLYSQSRERAATVCA
jgi:hypothetical protein